MNCRKCGAELHPEQKVCIQCGELTPAGGKFDVEEERHWRPSARQIKIGAAMVAVLLLALVLHKVLHVVPPEIVAKEWFEAMLSRNFRAAERHVTPAFEQDLSSRMMDPLALAETYLEEINANRATYEIGAPVYDRPSNPRYASIQITIKTPGGEIVRPILLRMAKLGRRWYVDRAV